MKGALISVKKIDEYPKEDLSIAGVVKMRKDEIISSVKKIEKSNMEKRHNTVCWDAMYDWIVDRCAIKSDEKHFYVFKDRLDAMLKQYSSGKIHCPSDLKFDVLNPLVRMFLEGDVSDC